MKVCIRFSNGRYEIMTEKEQMEYWGFVAKPSELVEISTEDYEAHRAHIAKDAAVQVWLKHLNAVVRDRDTLHIIPRYT